MDLHGHVQNGIVVLDGDVLLPDGTEVTVTPRSGPVIRVAKNRRRVELPLVESDQPGTLDLTNDRIAEILEAEDIEALKAQWNAPPGR